MLRGPRWWQSEGGPFDHAAGTSGFTTEGAFVAHEAGASVIPKRKQPPLPYRRGTGGPKAKKASSPMRRGP